MRMTDIPPAFVLLLGALLLPLLKGKARAAVSLLLPILALGQAAYVIHAGGDTHIEMMGMTLNPVHVHEATLVFTVVFAIMVFAGMLYAFRTSSEFGVRSSELRSNSELHTSHFELPAACVYAGGALGCLFAGDLISLFIFCEVMTLGSTTIIWAGRRGDSFGAGMRYFGMHALGGVLLMMGIIIVISQRIHAGDTDPLAFRHFGDFVDGFSLDWSSAGLWLVMIGMLVNAGAPPFSSWIPDAYPEASPSGTVFLSAFTTKTAVFTLLVGFAGAAPLIWIGIYMALYGVVYGILENDIRRLLCYSLVNQVGFMLVGIGIGNQLAIDGAAGHAFAHILYKALLFMATGSVLFATGRTKMNELGGLYRTMPVTMICLVIGGLAISGFPLTSGFTAKSLTVAGITQEANALVAAGQSATHLVVVWTLFQLATAGVFLDACVKLTWFIFFQKDSGLRPPEVPLNMRAAMIGVALICVFLGVYPQPLYMMLPYSDAALDYAHHVYTAEHVAMMLGLLLFAGGAFFLLLPLMKRTETITLDIDWIWRRFIPKFWHDIALPLLHGLERGVRAATDWIPGLMAEDERLPSGLRRRLPGTWAVSVPVLVISMMLMGYLLIYFWILA
jgi:multicomponent Na+:H+ antiporter subunit D